MVDLMYKQRTFCQFFFSSDTRKLTAYMMLVRISPSVIPTLATATPMHSTFFSWNLMLHLVSFTISSRFLLIGAGNLPALLRPGPRRRGIILMTESDARKAW
ncbi:hypothetical protein Vretimale_17154 [Volvox reticuliferus]|uniref:Uncharacterized protein n=1 Tax=Volvox reticuliferus TaxID=1737510 RepID=A0A8J4LWW2_9CHLO|nr:hypothetical protein Vretifemale_18592 [Volvox reticuliferus]GIM14139.1 hypothetical protein Vretimale_17154 [Volvox reticuliferus]